MSERKHFYLVVEDPKNKDREGGVSIFDTRCTPSEKNSQTIHHMRNFETGESWEKTMVSLGYYDFESEDDYENRVGGVVESKLGEIDERHLEDAGIDPDEVEQ